MGIGDCDRTMNGDYDRTMDGDCVYGRSLQ